MQQQNDVEMPVWIVDDDEDDHQLIKEIFDELQWKYPLQLFTHAEQMIDQLDASQAAPFIIISDVNLRGMDGFELRERLLSAPNKKFHSVPFIFWSTHAADAKIKRAYDLRAHGFFIKEIKFSDWKRSLIRIIEYWQSSKTPAKNDAPDISLL